MPFYEYYCAGCDEPFTLMRPMDERDEPAVCPECGAATTLREVSAFSTGGVGAAGGGGGSCGCGSGGFT